jgi:hypothetical protein
MGPIPSARSGTLRPPKCQSKNLRAGVAGSMIPSLPKEQRHLVVKWSLVHSRRKRTLVTLLARSRPVR